MSDDPLKFFLNEKTAAAAAPDTSIDLEEQKPFTMNPDSQSLDPGERAMAGILAVGGSTAGGLAQFIGQTVLGATMFSDAASIQRQQQLGPIKRLSQIQTGPIREPGGQILGLFE